MQFHNGEITFFWSDIRLPFENLIELIGGIGTTQLGFRRLAKVSDAVILSSWCTRRCREPQLQHLVTLIHATPLPKS